MAIFNCIILYLPDSEITADSLHIFTQTSEVGDTRELCSNCMRVIVFVEKHMIYVCKWDTIVLFVAKTLSS